MFSDGRRQEVEAVEALDGREPGGPDPALDHAPLAIDHFHLGQPHQVARMVDALGRAQARLLVVFAQEGRQLQRFEMMCEQDLRGLGHAATSVKRSMYDRADVVATVALGRYG